MREIKFRVWDQKWKEMFQNAWRVGMQLYYGVGGYNALAFAPKLVEERYQLMQFTGLHDKNGEEIYEGDILLVTEEDEEGYQTTVSYDGGAFIVDVNHCDYDSTAIGWAMDMWDGEDTTFEVIGNIYEKELLEVQP